MITFEELCRRWSISPFSSKSVYYKTFFKEGIIIGPVKKKPYRIDMKKLLAYEKKIGFEPGMVSVAAYVRLNKGLTKYKVLKMIEEGSVKSCILCKSENQIYYRLENK